MVKHMIIWKLKDELDNKEEKSLEIKMSKWLKKNSSQRMYICTGAFS